MVVPVGLPGPGLEEDVLQHEVVMVVVHEGKQVQLTRILALNKKNVNWSKSDTVGEA